MDKPAIPITALVSMDKSINPSFLKLMELNPGKDLTSIKQPLSVLLDGFLKYLRKYPETINFAKAGIFIQNAAFIYSTDVEELFNFVTNSYKALCSINLQPVNNLPAISNDSNEPTLNPENNTRGGSEESDEQVVSSKVRKQSRKKIEEHDNDPIDIADPWTSDQIDEQEEVAENSSELCVDQEFEVETVLGPCDNFESTESFIHRNSISRDRSKDLPKREFKILSHMDDDGFICSDFNIFEDEKSKRHNVMTIDLLEGSELMETIDRDRMSLGPTSMDTSEMRENDADDGEHSVNLQQRLNLNTRDEGLLDVRKFLDYDSTTDNFGVPVLCLEEYAKKYPRRNAVYKYEINRAVNSDIQLLQEALSIIPSVSSEYLDSTKEITFDPDVKFEGTQNLYDGDWHDWPREAESDEDQDKPKDLITDTIPDLDESQFVPEPEKIRKTGVEDVHKNVFTKRASRWIEKHKPIVEKIQKRKKFDIREYGDKVIETMSSLEKETPAPVQTLEDVLGQKSFKEASKYFLSILVLANSGNLELEKPKSEELTVNKCNIKLLSSDRHHDKLDEDISVQTVVPEKKNKK